MFVAEIENMNNNNTNNSINSNTTGPNTLNSQAISFIKDLNNFNQNAIESNLNINQQIINTSTKLLSIGSTIRSLNTMNKQIKSNNKQQQQQQLIDNDDNGHNNSLLDDDDGQKVNNCNNGTNSNGSSSTNNNNNNPLDDDILQVNCNSIVASLFKKKFGSGGKGKCIFVENKWMTPIEFEQYCGKGNCRDWKRTIKCGGQQLLTLLDNNVLLCHAVSCSCSVCSNDSNVVGPIRPFLRYRRRKRDEIVAQNAYKKFLSLKPPTLMATNDFDRLHSQANLLSLINNNNGNSNSLININNNSLNNNGNGNGNNHIKNDYSSIEDALSTISSTNSDYIDNNNHNHHDNNNNYSHLDTSINNNNGNACNISQNSINNNNSQINDYNDKNENNFNFKLSNSLKDMQKLEAKQWTLLEKAADILIIQSQNLKNLIQQAQNQTKMTKKYLVNELRQTNYHHTTTTQISNNNNYDDFYDTSDDNDEDNDDENMNYNNDHDNLNHFNNINNNKDRFNKKQPKKSINKSRIELNAYD